MQPAARSPQEPVEAPEQSGEAMGEPTAHSATDRMQAELEASLAAGFVPNGWEHRISWPAHSATGLWITGAGLIVGLVAGWVAWGWKAGLAAALVVVGLGMLASWRGGPRVGDEITESFTPPDEVLLELGIAGHELLKVERSRPTFSVTREATPADRRSARLGLLGMGAFLLINGGLVLLLESNRISPSTFLRSGAIVTAALLAALAVWAWRRIGLYSKLLGSRPGSDAERDTEDPLASATTGEGAIEAFGASLLSRLPLPVARVVTVAILLLTGALGVLIAFNVAPDESELWSSLAAGADLVLFVAAGVRSLILLGIGLLFQDAKRAAMALKSLALMGVLLLVAKLFGWLDEWQTVILWVVDRAL